MDWFTDLIGPDKEALTIAQMTVRGIVVFLFGLALIRIAGHRVFGKMSAFDLVLSVVVGSNLSRTLTGNAPFLATLAATTALVVLHWALSRMAVRRHWLGWLIKGSVYRLAERGRVDQRAMLANCISQGDLNEALHDKGQMRLRPSQSAYLERNGKISLVETDAQEST